MHLWNCRAWPRVQLLRQREWRLEWAEKIGMGFDLPDRPVGQLGQLIQFRKTG
jgi:hypothetical protein